ncbi:MAG: HlyD family efflux transporter periplasmic adaptor subunit [bacterium]|nr:HlyD family efflux transporter periplasmic adaptor subunit [bacterium]
MDIQRPSRKKEIRRRRLLVGFGVASLLVLLTVGIYSLEPAVRSVERGSLWFDTVKRGEMLRSVRGNGTLIPVEIRWISAQTDGRVERRVVEAGARVTPETVILELSNPELEQEAQDAELRLRALDAEYTDLEVRLSSQLLDQRADLATVKAGYEGAVLQVEADQELYTNGLIPEIMLKKSELAVGQLTVRYEIEQQRLQKTNESIKAQLSVKRAQVEQQSALFRLRREQLDSLEVRSSIAGILQEIPVEEGERVTPGVRLARVAQPDKLKAELRINETQAKDIEVDQVAIVDTRNGTVTGRVSRIDPAVQQGTVTVDVTLEGELPKGARPDLSVDGTIEIERLEDVLYMDRPGYGQAGNLVGLYVVDPKTQIASITQVRLGRTSVNTVEIVEGLEIGEEVILSDSSQWGDDPRIRLVD